jgi:sulfate permease, SulP family
MYHSQPPQPPLPWILQRVPALGALRGYSLLNFRSDLLAGLTVAAVAVPQAMAYALIAGLPAEIGLYTAIVMTLVGALFDSSRQLINGPTNAISIACLSILAPLTTPETVVPAAILLAFLIGSIQLGISFLRLGDLSRYISHSVILGFTTGASALLVLDQLKNLMGVKAGGGSHDSFVQRFYETWTHQPQIHVTTMWVGLGAIVAVLGLRAAKKRLGWVLFPELLTVVVAAAFVVGLLGLDQSGVKVIGKIPPHLPQFQLPAFDLELMRKMAGGATALALLGLLEATSMAKAIAAHTRQRLDMNQQFLSEGLANLAGSFFQCFPGSGSLTRSAINQQAGAVSQWSGVISAGAVAVTMVILAPYAKYVPRSALAGILMVAAFKMVEWKALAFHLRASRFDAVIILVTGLSAVFISIEFCVLIGVLLSFLMAVPRVGKSLLTEFVPTDKGYVHERLPSDVPCKQVLVFGLEGEMFFAAATSLESQLGRIEERVDGATEVVVLRLKRARNPDASGLSLLAQFYSDMRARGIRVLFCGVRGPLMESFEKARLVETFGTENIFTEQPVRQTSTHQAVEYAYSLVRHKCENCSRVDSSDRPAPSGVRFDLPEPSPAVAGGGSF